MIVQGKKRQVKAAAILTAFVTALTLAAPASSQEALTGVEKMSDADRAFAQAVFAAEKDKDCNTTLDLLVPRFKKKPAIEPGWLAAYFYAIAAQCKLDVRDYKAAQAFLVAGTAISDSPDDLWRSRLAVNLDASNLSGAVETIEAMSNGRGKALNDIPMRWLYELHSALRDDKYMRERARFLMVVGGPSYFPSDPLASTDGFRKDHAEMLHKAGQIERAAAVVATIDNPSVLVGFKVDPRFKSMVPRDFDERLGVEKQLDRARQLSRSNSDLLQPTLDASRYLRDLGRPADALTLLKALEQREGGIAGYKDQDEYLSWWWDSLGRTYAQLGQYEQMVDAFHHGAMILESGNPNVSQAINLVAAQVDFGKPQDALATMAEFKLMDRRMSPFGTMQMRYARGCAAALAGQADLAKADLDYMRAHEKDDPNALGELLLCVKDMDGAAALFIRLIKDPAQSADMLLKLSDYDAAPATQPVSPLAASLQALRDRADVRAAVAQAGGTLRIHLQRDSVW